MKINIHKVVILISVSINIFQFYLLNNLKYTKNESNESIKSEITNLNELSIDYSTLINDSINEFKKIGRKYGTDKATAHQFYNLYGKYVGPIRHKKINFLEIGLGCLMPYGPGKSLLLWKEYIPNAIINYLEYNRECAEKFRDKVNNLFIGDQSDFDFLKELEQAGPYDVIVDDGGHSRKQQINAIIGLWPYLKPKGYYIIEDMYFSFLEQTNDNPESTVDVICSLISKLNEPPVWKGHYVPIANITLKQELVGIYNELLSIDCFMRACVLTKK